MQEIQNNIAFDMYYTSKLIDFQNVFTALQQGLFLDTCSVIFGLLIVCLFTISLLKLIHWEINIVSGNIKKYIQFACA